jgi:lysophospholipase L1-like esterase
MPFGDSITATGCWREKFLLKLADGGYQVDMVGSNKQKQCNESDADNEGHSSKLITQEKDNVAGWAQANPADVVLFHWGTNDVWKSSLISDDYVSEVLAAYATAVDGLRSGNPNVIVIVAQIIPLSPSNGSCSACPNNVQKLNAAIPAWASTKSTTASPVLVADLWSGFDPATGTQDGAHPYTATGVEHMASRWYEAFETLF